MEEKAKLVEDIMELLREQKKVLEELVQKYGYHELLNKTHKINKKIGYKINEL